MEPKDKQLSHLQLEFWLKLPNKILLMAIPEVRKEISAILIIPIISY
ncbi:hypothetical protein [uncultured Muribaculum sp.]|nr:hypothetical protein [uncultured Muribaculum sp.]